MRTRARASTRATGTRPTIAVAAAAVALSLTAPAHADEAPTHEAPDDLPEAPFRDGEWLGTFAAQGPAEADFPEASMALSTVMQGDFHALVEGGEVTDGAWQLSGSSQGTISSSFGTGTTSNVYSGSGPVSGDRDGLRLGGGLDTTWTQQMGGSTDTYDDPIRLGPFDVEVTGADCRRLTGRWTEAFAAEIAEAGGWESDLQGSFVALHQGEEADASLREDAEELFDDYDDWVTDVHEGALDAVAEGGAPLDRGLRDRLNGLVNRAVDLEIALADASADEACLFDDRLGTFQYQLTSLIQEVALWLLQLEGEATVDGFTIYELTDVLLWTGGIGAGAQRPEAAERLTDLLAERSGEVLDEHLITDGSRERSDGTSCSDSQPCLPPDEEVVRTLIAAARLGVPVTVGGSEVPSEHLDQILSEGGQ